MKLALHCTGKLTRRSLKRAHGLRSFSLVKDIPATCVCGSLTMKGSCIGLNLNRDVGERMT